MQLVVPFKWRKAAGKWIERDIGSDKLPVLSQKCDGLGDVLAAQAGQIIIHGIRWID